jgi:two-component system, response regulator PdtaR
MPKRVLIAEDNWLTPTVLRAELESHGYEVVGVARTGTEAVDMTRAERPDVVLMDIQMPEVDGIQATRSIMEDRPTCVVIVTGRSELSQVAEQSGAMAYLVKPFLPDEILAVVGEATQRYEWFTQLVQECPDVYHAVQAWPRVQRAVRALSDRDRSSEKQAFEQLQQLAAERGTGLTGAADAVIGEAEAHAHS